MFGFWDRAAWVLVKFVFSYIWGFPKIRGVLFGCPYNTDSNTLGSILGSPFFGSTVHTSKKHVVSESSHTYMDVTRGHVGASRIRTGCRA